MLVGESYDDGTNNLRYLDRDALLRLETSLRFSISPDNSTEDNLQEMNIFIALFYSLTGLHNGKQINIIKTFFGCMHYINL